MSSEILERLRAARVSESWFGAHGDECVPTELGRDAADRIEALEKKVALLKTERRLREDYITRISVTLKEVGARAERLRAALEEIASGRYSGLVLTSIPPQDPAVRRAREALEGSE